MIIEEGKVIDMNRAENAPYKDVLNYLKELGSDLIPCINYSLGITISKDLWIQFYTPATTEDGWDIGFYMGANKNEKWYYGIKSFTEIKSIVENVKPLFE